MSPCNLKTRDRVSPTQQRTRVFDRFYRLDGDQHESGVIGCGLGLAIVNHIAELHAATVQLGVSGFGSGLLVSVIFPRKALAASNHATASETRSLPCEPS